MMVPACSLVARKRHLIDGIRVAAWLFWEFFHARWKILFSCGGDMRGGCDMTVVTWGENGHIRWFLCGGGDNLTYAPKVMLHPHKMTFAWWRGQLDKFTQSHLMPMWKWQSCLAWMRGDFGWMLPWWCPKCKWWRFPEIFSYILLQSHLISMWDNFATLHPHKMAKLSQHVDGHRRWECPHKVGNGHARWTWGENAHTRWEMVMQGGCKVRMVTQGDNTHARWEMVDILLVKRNTAHCKLTFHNNTWHYTQY